ncbi:invasion associated locus B family protein [Nisaea acidiphila]|uniref:Invasion associated locus B family protein n=1 Tax=Nisaea acidiphila TaxID=1862145 RepID=A0A9J7APP5_9PROT|nr:invasion associated locus B family protein [Nisaea acidiphila]UUX48324.1 invasion associated locus B family protein [Nisaea acidiphila]
MAGSGPMTHFRSFWLGAVLALGIAGVAQAQEPQTIGRNNDWIAYTYKSGGKTVCYMASTPLKAEGNYSKRGHIYALVTHHPDAESRGEFSIVTGYTYKTDSEVDVEIGSRTYKLFTDKDRAWAPDGKTDGSIVSAMIKGSKMVVKGVSSRGTRTTDTYSLRGFTATKKLIDKTCRK